MSSYNHTQKQIKAQYNNEKVSLNYEYSKNLILLRATDTNQFSLLSPKFFIHTTNQITTNTSNIFGFQAFTRLIINGSNNDEPLIFNNNNFLNFKKSTIFKP